jgi:hypothetical protein
MDPVTTPPAGIITPTGPQAVKPGYQTTEFYLSLISVILGAVISSGIVPETGPYSQIVGLIAAVLGSLGYTVSRGIVKQSQ